MSDVYVNPLTIEVSPNDYQNLGSLSEDMVYRLPGCADLMIRKTLQNVFREFCLTTWALRGTSEHAIVADQASYNIVIPSSTYIHRIVSVYKGTSLLVENVDYTALTGTPAKVVLKSVPTSADSAVVLKVETVCVPTRGSEDVPTWFSEMYGDALISGALYKLFAMDGKPWADTSQAKLEGIAWQNAINEASSKSISGSQVSGKELNAINYGGMI